jgi:hypothetical protein
MTNDRLQKLLNLILFTDEITPETENAHVEICDEFDMLHKQNKQLIKLWETNHLLTCLAEECGEVMKIMFLEPDNKGKIEHELNDIIAVAHLLHNKDIVCADLDGNDMLTKSNNTNLIFECVGNIQHVSHKAIRFGLLDTKPNSQRKNIDEVKYLLHTLVLLISADETFSVNENHNNKIAKVLNYLDYAKRTTLGIHENIKQSKDLTYEELKMNIARAGLTIKEFAELMGLHPNSITNLKQREIVPKNIAIISLLMAELAGNKIDIKSLLKDKYE